MKETIEQWRRKVAVLENEKTLLAFETEQKTLELRKLNLSLETQSPPQPEPQPQPRSLLQPQSLDPSPPAPQNASPAWSPEAMMDLTRALSLHRASFPFRNRWQRHLLRSQALLARALMRHGLEGEVILAHGARTARRRLRGAIFAVLAVVVAVRRARVRARALHPAIVTALHLPPPLFYKKETERLQRLVDSKHRVIHEAQTHIARLEAQVA